MKSRIVVLFIGFCLLWTLLVLRAANLQFLPNERLQALRDRQFRTVVTLPARRGAITDRKGRDLALSAEAFSLYADPKLIENRRAVARRLAKELGVSPHTMYAKIKDGRRRFVWIQRLLDPETAERVRALGVRGLSLVQEWRRIYPNESILAPTLGFLGIDGQALEGLELHYDSALRGDRKKVMVRRDARGRPLMADGLLFQQNPDGKDVTLTVDSEIQYMLESELVGAVQEFDAASAVGIVLDAQTSAIRALATVPTFDANRALKVSPESRRNRVVADAFEQGSTMKTFVVAAALRAGRIHANSKFFCENGIYRIADRTIRDDVHKFGWLTVSEILAFSSNIGATKIAFQVGDENLRQALMDFGFGQRLGIDLPGEARGILKDLPWRSHLLSNISFGHGMSATPLQVANAYAAAVNGGVLHRPYLVESVHDVDSGAIHNTTVEPLRRVLTPAQSEQMRLLLSGVTAPGGTGVNAKVNGFIIGGKTGTAQKADLKQGGYLKGAYVSSFAGFIPSSDPRFVIYIAVDQPRKAYYGSQVAAPIFSRIASYVARKEGLAPIMLSERNLVQRPAPRGPAEVGTLKDVEPAALPARQIVTAPDLKLPDAVPDFQNLTVREVLRRVNGRDLKLRLWGRGVVSETRPSAGEPLPDDREITVILR